MDKYAINWIKKNLGTYSHEYPFMILIAADRPDFMQVENKRHQ